MTTVPTDMVRSELEKLEQNITLTLQAIDQNFAKCHHVVSTKILPHVERYAEASREVWNGSKVCNLDTVLEAVDAINK